MTRSILKSWCLAAAVFAVPARALAVWPPSTSFEEKPTPPVDVRADAEKLEQDERRLAELIQDLQDDAAALKNPSKERSDIRRKDPSSSRD